MQLTVIDRSETYILMMMIMMVMMMVGMMTKNKNRVHKRMIPP
jgi:hypothetical protein